MITRLLAIINDAYPLHQQDIGAMNKAKVSVMSFDIAAYKAEALGHVSVMKASGLFGLMKMDTLIVNPFDKDAPLFSYDRIHAMGKDKCLLEFFETRLDRQPIEGPTTTLSQAYRDIADDEANPCWYDDLVLPIGTRKAGKKGDSSRLDAMTMAYLKAYLDIVKAAPVCDPNAKKREAAKYSEGLLANGGPSTDQFVKAKGLPYTQQLFRKVLFGTGSPMM